MTLALKCGYCGFLFDKCGYCGFLFDLNYRLLLAVKPVVHFDISASIAVATSVTKKLIIILKWFDNIFFNQRNLGNNFNLFSGRANFVERFQLLWLFKKYFV